MAEKIRVLYLCTSNVCRSPLAEAVAKNYIKSQGLDSRVEVSSRGLTDQYSAWSSPAERRMLVAASEAALPPGVLASLRSHRSALLSRSEVLDGGTFLMLVTAEHESWARHAVGSDAIDKAREEGRVALIHSRGEDIRDPYFGDETHYREVCAVICHETPLTLAVITARLGFLKSP